MRQTKQILEIETEPEVRPTVKIDGKEYDLLTPSDMSLADQIRINQAIAKVGEDTVGAKTEEDARSIDERTDALVRQVLPGLPDDLAGRLKFLQKSAILIAFRNAGAQTNREAASAARGTGSSLASSGTTAEAAGTGSASAPAS